VPHVQNKLARVWTKMNPSEPTPLYLAKFMAFAIGMFIVAFLIGQA